MKIKPLYLYAKLKYEDLSGSKEFLRAIIGGVEDDRIDINGNKVTVSLTLEELTPEIKTTLINAEEIIEMHFGKTTNNQQRNNTAGVKQDDEQISADVAEKTHEQEEDNAEESNTYETSKQDDINNNAESPAGNADTYEPDARFVKAPLKEYLDNISRKVNNYEEFIKEVATWCNMKSKTDIFTKLVYTAEKIEGNFAWSKFESIFKNQGEELSKSDKVYCSTLVRKHFDKFNINSNIMGLLAEMLNYREILGEVIQNITTFDSSENKSEEESSIEEDSEKEASVKSEVLTFKDTPAYDVLKEKAEDIKRKNVYSITELIGHLLKEMDVSECMEFADVVKMTGVAVCETEDEPDIRDVILRCDFDPEKYIEAEIIMAQFINDFAKENGNTQLVDVDDFLKEFKLLVMED